jgi:Polyketide cyclase / dehydrase and lipid transport
MVSKKYWGRKLLVLKSTVCIEASPEQVWRYLSAVENVTLWVPAINKAWCETKTSRGIGTERVCELDKFSVREIFVEWEEGESFKYVATGAPMIKTASNRWSLEDIEGQTLVTSHAEIVVKGGVFGRLLEPLIFLATKLGLPNALAPLKYHVETGKPFEGNAKDLPLAPAFC